MGVEQTPSVAGARHPAEDFVLDGKSFHRGPQEPGRQGKSVHLERNREVGAGFEETVDPEFGVAFETENLDLHHVHQGVNQGPLRQSLIESDEIDVNNMGVDGLESQRTLRF